MNDMKSTLKEMCHWAWHTREGQMCGWGCFLMDLGFGFWHALGLIGFVLYFRCWDE